MNQKDELEQNQQTAQAEETAAETPKAEEVRDQEPVSYTHLDVYKRQALYR